MQLHFVVNVLKHGKGHSYETLESKFNEYLRPCFPNIIRVIHGCEVLNISKENLFQHCDNIIDYWKK